MNDSVRRALCQLKPDWDLAAVEIIEFLDGGYSNDNYRIRYQNNDFALRTPQLTQPFVDRLQEAEYLAQLPPNLTAFVVAHDVSSGAMLTNWVQGTLLVDAWPELSMDQLVRYLVDLHSQLPHPNRYYDLDELTQLYGVTEFKAHGAAHQHPCHNDLNPWNIIVTDTDWITLDWEFAGTNDPLFDLVGLHQGLELPEENLPEFAERYLSAVGENYEPARLESCLYNFWLREYSWAQYQLARGNRRDEIRDQHQIALKFLQR